MLSTKMLPTKQVHVKYGQPGRKKIKRCGRNVLPKRFQNKVPPSPAEQLIMNVLKELHVSFEREISFEGFTTPNGGHYRFDFYVPAKKMLMEYDGKDFHINSGADAAKNRFCKRYGLKLVRLDFNHYYQMETVIRNLFPLRNGK
jgi:hypothetical protein